MSTISDALQAGLEHHRAGRLRQAEQMYRDVLSRHPRNAQAIHLLGLIAYQSGQTDDALKLLGTAAELDANNATFHADLGDVLRAQGKVPEGIAACQRALRIKPDMADVHNCLGALHRQEGNREQAAECFRQAVALDPAHARGHANLGTELRAVGKLREAQASFERAVKLAPDNANYYLSLGVCHYDQGTLLDAIACYQRALRLSPGDAMAHFNTGLARLALGELSQGWHEFEFRQQFESLVRRRYALPLWTGESMPAGALLVHAEQGFGDALQFVRYVPLLVQRGIQVVLDAHQELVSLFEQSIPAAVRADGVAPAECTHHIPLMSLPRVFDTTLETIPAQVPYLSARDDLVAKWHDKLAGLPGPRIGFHWQGRPDYYNDRARSIPLAQFAPLAAMGGLQFVSLQKSADGTLWGELAANASIVDVADELTDFHETAAVLRNLDLVICCDSAVAHLAGALGTPVWVALSVGSDWRWMQNRNDSPWYPTMRLFRQQTLGDWPPVFDEIAAALRGSLRPGASARS
jgi:tetratricopeptide (TPR) repeat protein